MIFIFYPSMIVKDVQRNSVFCQTITFHWGKGVTLQRYAFWAGHALGDIRRRLLRQERNVALLVYNRKWQSSENRMMLASIMSSREKMLSNSNRLFSHRFRKTKKKELHFWCNSLIFCVDQPGLEPGTSRLWVAEESAFCEALWRPMTGTFFVL